MWHVQGTPSTPIQPSLVEPRLRLDRWSLSFTIWRSYKSFRPNSPVPWLSPASTLSCLRSCTQLKLQPRQSNGQLSGVGTPLMAQPNGYQGYRPGCLPRLPSDVFVASIGPVQVVANKIKNKQSSFLLPVISSASLLHSAYRLNQFNPLATWAEAWEAIPGVWSWVEKQYR